MIDLKQSLQSGFTLVEILVVVMIIGSVTVVSGFYLSRILDKRGVQSSAVELLSAYQLAQDNAVNAIEKRDHGVRLVPGTTRYELVSRDGRGTVVKERGFELPKVTSVSGPNLIIFARLDGRPESVGTIVISGNYFKSEVIIGSGGEVTVSPPQRI